MDDAAYTDARWTGQLVTEETDPSRQYSSQDYDTATRKRAPKDPLAVASDKPTAYMVDQARALVREGLSTYAAAARLGMSPTWTRGVTKDLRSAPPQVPKLTPEARERVDALVREGLTVVAVMAATGATNKQVVNRRKALGRSKPSGLPPETVAAICRRYLEGVPHAQIAREFGVSHNASKRRAKRTLGLRRMPPRGERGETVWTPEKVAEVRALRNEGVARKVIARRLNLSLFSLNHIISSPRYKNPEMTT